MTIIQLHEFKQDKSNFKYKFRLKQHCSLYISYSSSQYYAHKHETYQCIYSLMLGWSRLREWRRVSGAVKEGGGSNRARATLNADGTDKHTKNNRQI